MRETDTTSNDVLNVEFSFHNLPPKWSCGQKDSEMQLLLGHRVPRSTYAYLEIILQTAATSSSLRLMYELLRRKVFCAILRETCSSMGNRDGDIDRCWRI